MISDVEQAAGRLDRARLSTDLAAQVTHAERELHATVAADSELRASLHADHDRAVAAQRNGRGWADWLDEQVTLSSVAWVLGTVFVRWCEDNELIEPHLSGPGNRLGDAEDAQQQFISANPLSTSTDWLRVGFGILAASDAGAMLFDPRHNPAERIPFSNDGARSLIAFWRRRGGDGRVVHDFTDQRDDGRWDTRFLGDLYQDLSESARERFRLFQTPVFVEDFILSLTLDPAIAEFGLDGFRLIDPTCGSGHFLLGAFDRLVAAWRDRAPGLDRVTLARRALDSVHGVDINPFAVAISRFRLLLAAWQVAGVSTLVEASGQSWRMAIAVGDSLLPGENQDRVFGGSDDVRGLDQPWEDIHDFADERLLVEGSYEVVVGNPPYNQVTDGVLNHRYRRLYSDVCSGKYALTAPFARRFTDLARQGNLAGFVGQLTSNSFMTRDFGVPLIEKFLIRIDLTYVIDTSGAYIPGHGTPTVILISRNRAPSSIPVRAVLGIRSEPEPPEIASKGLVWTAIVRQIDRPGGLESRWVEVVDLPQSDLASHPWSLDGGGARDLFASLEHFPDRLSTHLRGDVGFASFPGSDESFITSQNASRVMLTVATRPLILGDGVRDWCIATPDWAVVPYDRLGRLVDELDRKSLEVLWPRRRVLQSITGFRGVERLISGEVWFSWYRWVVSRYADALSITFAEISTHNHFVLDRGGRVFKQTAPVLKLPSNSNDAEYLSLLGILNSSVACFWLKQVSHNKGRPGAELAGADEPWEHRYQFAGTKVQQFPLPHYLPLARAAEINELASELTASLPDQLVRAGDARAVNDPNAFQRASTLRSLMITEQEELDWEVYAAYGLLSNAERQRVLLPDGISPEPILNGQRASEILLARLVDSGVEQTTYFTHHDIVLVVNLPNTWSESYRRVVEERIGLISGRADLALLESTNCKRRWASPPPVVSWPEDWNRRRRGAVRSWLLTRLEDRRYWFAPDVDGVDEPVTQTVRSLASVAGQDAELVEVAQMWAADALGTPDADLVAIVGQLIDEEHVPFLAAYRYKGKGLTKRSAWERTWDLQRAEDRIAARIGQDIGHPDVRAAVKAELGMVPVPPKYGPADFVRSSYWGARGKLDVPKERFTSYPGAAREGDGSLTLGWAGWDALQRAQALAALIATRREDDGWGIDRLTPLLAGLAEQLPWVAQWHPEVDPRFGSTPADIYGGFLADFCAQLGLTAEDLASWRPAGRVDVAPVPRVAAPKKSAARRTKVPRSTRRESSKEDDSDDPSADLRSSAPAVRFAVDDHRDAVLEAALRGPLSNEDIRAATGLDAIDARTVAKALVDRGLLTVIGQRRGTRYALAIGQ
jgi:hypothetical protein